MSKKCPKCFCIRYKVIRVSLIDEDTYKKVRKCLKCFEDYEETLPLLVPEIYEGQYNNRYPTITVPEEGRAIALHIWAWKSYYGKNPKHWELIHHKNWKKNDSRISNLIALTKSKHIHSSWDVLRNELAKAKKKIRNLENENRKLKTPGM